MGRVTENEAPHALEEVLHYHEETKHQLDRLARYLGYLDWANQPNPFRFYDGAPRHPLAHPQVTPEPAYDELFEPGRLRPRPLNHETISQLFYDSLALSAWKRAPGVMAWSQRVNPSSGDLHPTEGYLISGPIEGLHPEPAVYHYSPFYHALEQRLTLSTEEWEAVTQQLPSDGVLVALNSIYWRESWKYGERAFRYCHHDVGHAIGTMTIAAAVLGWRTRLIETISDSELAQLLGLSRQSGLEAEHPDCLLAVLPREEPTDPPLEYDWRPPAGLLERLSQTEFLGAPNTLSQEHHHWPIIDEVVAATRYEGQAEEVWAKEEPDALYSTGNVEAATLPKREVSARAIIRQRRSAMAMDGQTSISCDTFFHMLERVTPRPGYFPFDVLRWRPQVSLVLLIHRVVGLEPGLYLFVRHSTHLASLQAALRPEFEWCKPDGCPKSMGLYRLEVADARAAAQGISCHQPIAGNGAFALGMLARFEPVLRLRGAWFYPRLFWETGLIGQVLYLEAEAAGIRSTGIGCFFDDAMHDLLGIQDRSWQSLYHFTVGGAVEDPRLQTIDSYMHLRSSSAKGAP